MDKRNSRYLKVDLEAKTAGALDQNSTKALVVLAFVAVIREGLETAIFQTLPSLREAPNVVVGLVRAILGIVVAAGMGYAMYKGGAPINLSRFFRITGVVLVLVAAGLVASSIHEFAEAGVLPWWQTPAFDPTAIVAPGTIRAGLLTAFLGVQAVPTYAEVVGWLLFLAPAAWYVLSRPHKKVASPAI